MQSYIEVNHFSHMTLRFCLCVGFHWFARDAWAEGRKENQRMGTRKDSINSDHSFTSLRVSWDQRENQVFQGEEDLLDAQEKEANRCRKK